MKKNDIILIGILLGLALVSLGGITLYSNLHTRDAEAVVTVDGTEFGRYPLTEDVTVEIPGKNGGSNTLVIQDGMADIKEATCPDKICVRHKPIDRTGETLVCLPNQVVVEIRNGQPSQVDAGTN